MGFSLKALGEHTEKRRFEIYGQTLTYEFRPAVLTRPLQRRLRQLEDLDDAAQAEYAAALEAWEAAEEEDDKPEAASPALDELCAITQQVIAAWDIEDGDGRPIPIPQVRARVEDGTIPLLLLFKVFADAIQGGQDVPKRGDRRR